MDLAFPDNHWTFSDSRPPTGRAMTAAQATGAGTAGACKPYIGWVCRARQAAGVVPLQRRKARVNALASA